MAKLHGIEERGRRIGFAFKCPGCDTDDTNSGIHAIYDVSRGSGSPVWQFNGNMDRPTFSPSLLTHVYGRNDPRKCHLFIKDGQIQYCSDCYHPLAGKTVALPDWD